MEPDGYQQRQDRDQWINGGVYRMTHAHVKAVADIERDCTDGERWGESGFRSTLDMESKGRHGLVFRAGGNVLGFLMFAVHGRLICPMHMAVHPTFRRLGIATELMDCLKSYLNEGDITRIEVMTRETWLDAQLFLKSQGFTGKLIPGAFRDKAKNGDSDEIIHSDGIAFTYRLPRASNGEGALGPLDDDVLSLCAGK